MMATCVAVLAVALVSSGCSDDSATTPSAGDKGASTATPSQDARDATAVANLLRQSIPEITKVITVTETNDSNNLIGRPGGYASAAVLVDSRVPGQTPSDPETGPTIDMGARVEIYPTEAGAQQRAALLETVAAQAPMLANDWVYREGKVVLRVSGKLLPSVNDQYHAAWTRVLTEIR